MTGLDKLPRDALTLICDARKALFLRNIGTPFAPVLEVEEVLEAPENPPNHVQEADRPGRRIDRTAAGAGSGPRSAMEPADPHARAEERFARDVAARLEARDRRAAIDALVIAAPAPFLGDLRRRLPARLRAAVLGEIPKDLTPLPLAEMAERLLRG
jgi:protein required for attachment to host cells